MCGAGDKFVGNENEGWTYAKYLLGHERAGSPAPILSSTVWPI